LPGLELDYGQDLADDHRAGLSITAGVLLQPTSGWKMLASATWLDYRLGEKDQGLQAAIAQNLAMGRDRSLRMDWRYWQGISEFSLGLQVYF
jgi:hypothetical protein